MAKLVSFNRVGEETKQGQEHDRLTVLVARDWAMGMIGHGLGAMMPNCPKRAKTYESPFNQLPLSKRKNLPLHLGNHLKSGNIYSQQLTNTQARADGPIFRRKECIVLFRNKEGKPNECKSQSAIVYLDIA